MLDPVRVASYDSVNKRPSFPWPCSLAARGVIGGKAVFLGTFERGGRVCPGDASLLYRSMGVLEKKFSEILEDSEFVWHGCGHGAAGGVFCDAANQELSKSSCAKPRYRPSTSMDCK
jgi:hypothetical protein